MPHRKTVPSGRRPSALKPMCSRLLIVLWLLGFSAAQPASTPASQATPSSASDDQPVQSQDVDRTIGHVDSGYVLGPGDQISIRVLHVDEISDKPINIDADGFITVQLIGRLHVAKLTLPQVESKIAERLHTYVLNPDVSVSVVEYHSQPVSLIGAVKNPGIHQIQGRKTLVEMLSLAGGVDSTTAGSKLTITRRREWGQLPLPGAKNDPTNQFSIAHVNVKSLIRGDDPTENITVRPNDIISVPRADTVYVISEVLKAGGFLFTEDEHITVLQALSMAGGLDRMAQPQNARLLRRMAGIRERTEIVVNVKNILNGKSADLQMQPEDILFIPDNVPKRAAVRALEAGVQMGTGVVIWRRP